MLIACASMRNHNVVRAPIVLPAHGRSTGKEFSTTDLRE